MQTIACSSAQMSPSSPSSSEEHPSNESTLPLAETPSLGPSLNLAPCTSENFLQLPSSPNSRYELVDQILVWRGEMDKPPHSRRRDYFGGLFRCLIQEGQLDALVHIEAGVAIPSRRAENIINGIEKMGYRRPDVLVTPMENEKDEKRSPDSKRIQLSSKHKGFLIAEITSDSTRMVDLNEKWLEYASRDIPEYVIIDEREMCVIVGVLEEACGMYTADPTISDSQAAAKNAPHHIQPQRMYCRYLFYDKDRITKGLICSLLQITAGELIACPHIERIMRGRWMNLARRADKETRRADKETQRAKKYKALARQHGLDVSSDSNNSSSSDSESMRSTAEPRTGPDSPPVSRKRSRESKR